MTRNQLGRRIKNLRFEKFGSVRNAAQKLEMSYETLRSVENGKIKRIDVFWLMKISAIFGVDLLAEIQDGEHDENTPHHARGDVNSNCRND